MALLFKLLFIICSLRNTDYLKNDLICVKMFLKDDSSMIKEILSKLMRNKTITFFLIDSFCKIVYLTVSSVLRKLLKKQYM